jgi:hypothetical protein
LVKLGGPAPGSGCRCGIPVYGIARITLDRFYRSFDTTPEEVGLSQGSILAQAALYLTAALMSFAAIGIIFGVIWLLVRPFVPNDAVPGIISVSLGLAPLVFAGLMAALQAARVRDPVHEQDWLDISGETTHPRSVEEMAARIRADDPVHRFFFGTWPRKIVTVIAYLLISGTPALLAYVDEPWALPAVIIVAIAVTGFLTAERGRDLALKVRKGDGCRGVVLGMHSDRVCVDWIEGARPPALYKRGPFMYLGEGERWLVLYDTDRESTLRLPAGKAAISAPLDGSCDQIAPLPIEKRSEVASPED